MADEQTEKALKEIRLEMDRVRGQIAAARTAGADLSDCCVATRIHGFLVARWMMPVVEIDGVGHYVLTIGQARWLVRTTDSELTGWDPVRDPVQEWSRPLGVWQTSSGTWWG